MESPEPRPSTPLELEVLIGSGRTSLVWRARRAPSGAERSAPVAVKVLRTALLTEPDARAAFEAETAAARAVHHPALLRLVEAGRDHPPPLVDPRSCPEAQHPDPRSAWLAMELVPGPTLETVLRDEGPLPEPVLRAFGTRLADALAALHAAGWTHGDLKPENARLDGEGTPVLLDLGFARRVGSPSAPLGTPAYVAPERAHGGAPTPAADVYALAATLYRLGTGHHAGANEAGERPPGARIAAPSTLVPRLSPFLDDLLLAGLDPGPASRPTALELARALAEGERGEWWRGRVRFGADARRDTATWSGAHLLPLVGRSEELERLHTLWHGAREGGQAVWLEGERGAGKSRLVAELAHRVRRADAEPPLYLYGRCGEQEEERPAAAILALLHRWLHLPREASPGKREAQLVHDLLPEAEARTLLDALAEDDSLGGDTPVTETAALAVWLVRLARSKPAIVFLDDVDAAGRATLDVLGRVARDLEDTRLLLVIGLRNDRLPEHEGALDSLRARLSGAERIALGPLREADVLELVEQVFHSSVPRRSLARVLHERSGGNVGRIGELLRLAGSRGWTPFAPQRVERDSSETDETPPRPLLELRVAPSSLPRPASLSRAVAERRGALPGRDRIWLERAAILGGRVTAARLARAYPRAARRITGALARLARAGWLVPAGDRFRFARPVEREEIVHGIPTARRRRLHAAAARAFEGSPPGGEDAYRRVRHLREAGADEALLAELPPLLERAREGGHPRRRAVLAGWGLEALDRLESTDERDETRRGLLETLADAADRLGARDEQRAALEALADLPLDAEREPRAAGRVYTIHSRAAIASGELGLARGLLRNAVELLGRSGEEGRDDYAEALLLAAQVEMDVGDLVLADRLVDRAWSAANSVHRTANAQVVAAELAALVDAWEDGLASAEDAVEMLDDAPDTVHTRAALAAAHLVRGRLLRLVGRQRRAWAALARATRLADQSGETGISVEAGARRARLLLDVDRERDAELELREALLLARTIEDRRGQALVTLHLGTLLAERGDPTARATLDAALGLAREMGLARTEALGTAIQARIVRAEGRLGDGLALIEKASALIERHGAELPDRIVVEATHSLLLTDLGRRREGRRRARSIVGRVERDNRRIADRELRERHRDATGALLRAALSPYGPVYPRLRRSGLVEPS